MKFFDQISGRKKAIFLLMLSGFLIKYNYLNWYIFQTISITALISKNLIIIISALLILSITFKSNKRIYLAFFSYLFFIVFFFANLWYNRYFGNYLSLADMTMGQGIRPLKVLLRQLTGSFDLLFIFEIPVLIYLIFLKRSAEEKVFLGSDSLDSKKYKIIIILLILILSGFHLFYTNNLYAVDGFFELYQHSTPAFVSVYGIIPLYFAELYTAVSQEESDGGVDESELLVEKDLSGAYDLSNIENIIVIQLESFDQKVIDYSYNGKELCPFLNKLKSQSLYFNNVYAQHVNGSFDAEFSFLTSIYPINKNYVFKTNDMSQFNSIVKILKQRNFKTLAFHGNQADFFFRNKAYPEIAFDHFYHRENFSISEAEIGKESYLGINDYDFFKQSLKYLELHPTPFFAFFITVTSHTPFDFYPEEYRVEEFEDLSPQVVRDYFNSVHFTDYSLKVFFEALKERNLVNNTLFIFYSDHSSDIRKESYSSEADFIMEGNAKEPENIPLIIYNPKLKPEIINKTGTHTDIAPTIFDLLGDSKKADGFLGVSLLKEKENSVLFLHEMPQILYHNNLFLKLPDKEENKAEFRRIAYKNEDDLQELPEKEQQKMIKIINYVQELMKKTIVEAE